MIVLDASVLIAHLDGQDEHHSRAEDLLVGLTAEPLGASTITLAEVLVASARAGVLEQAVSALEQLGIEGIPLRAEDAPRLAELRASTALKLPECCVLIAAAREGRAGHLRPHARSRGRTVRSRGLLVAATRCRGTEVRSPERLRRSPR